MQLQELLGIAKSITIQMSASDIKLTEELTLKQSDSWLWQKMRVGRVTGSTFMLVCRTNIKKPAKSTIMKICYPEKCVFCTNEIRNQNGISCTKNVHRKYGERSYKLFL